MSMDAKDDRAASSSVYLELSEGSSHKFYEVTVNGVEVTIRYGRIGTPGQPSSKTYATPEQAQADATKKINEKQRKGYVQRSSGEVAATPVDRPTERLSTVETETSPSSRSIDLATLPVGIESGLNVLRIPLARSLVALEITVACDPSTVRRNASNSGNIIYPAFMLNLGVGNDIAYHMGVRPLQGQVVQNTCVAGGWGLEENRPIPAEFLSDQPFTLRVALEQTVVVSLNGEVFSRFAHRLPATQIDAVQFVYPPGNLQVQSVQVVEHADGEIETPADMPSESPTDNHPLSPAIAPPSPQPSPSSLLRPPTIELLNQAMYGSRPLPAIARTDLSHGNYPLGFTLRENQSCSFHIPLLRSLVCLEIVATCHRSTTSGFTFRFCVQETVTYSFDFYPHTAQIAVGQLFHLVLVLTAQQTMSVYVNNQLLPDTPQQTLSEPLDELVLGYDASAVELQMLRVFEPQRAEAPRPAINRAIALPTPAPTAVSAPDTSPATIDHPPFLQDLPAQFEPLRSFFAANLVPYIKIQAGAKVGSLDWLNGGTGDPLTVWQSKIGGNPYFPKDRAYPTESDTGKAMPLLLQINCADVPPIAGFDFPQQGMLQFYLGFEPADASATPGKYRVLYFPELLTDVQDLITDFSFLEIDNTIQEIYPEVYPLTFAVSHDLFGESRPVETMDLPEELQELGAAFDEWLGDYLHETETRIRGSKLGGYVDLHSDTDEIAESANGRLLLELIHPFSSDDSFLFFIPDDQLRDRDFSQVEFYFVCD
jgi:uncharacterized protein YwqG/predicted DNA-binding WGR domain protein